STAAAVAVTGGVSGTAAGSTSGAVTRSATASGASGACESTVMVWEGYRRPSRRSRSGTADGDPRKRKNPGDDLFSRKAALSVSSALESLTSVFGMGTGVASPLESPGSSAYWFVFRQRLDARSTRDARGAPRRSSISESSRMDDRDHPSH